MTSIIKTTTRATAITFITAFYFVLIACTSQSTTKDCTTYEEAELPVEVTTDWSDVPSGIQASVGSIDKKYIQHEVPEITYSDNWSGTAWKGERTSAQLVLWSKDSVPSVELKLSDFKGENGATISSNNIINNNFTTQD